MATSRPHRSPGGVRGAARRVGRHVRDRGLARDPEPNIPLEHHAPIRRERQRQPARRREPTAEQPRRLSVFEQRRARLSARHLRHAPGHRGGDRGALDLRAPYPPELASTARRGDVLPARLAGDAVGAPRRHRHHEHAVRRRQRGAPARAAAAPRLRSDLPRLAPHFGAGGGALRGQRGERCARRGERRDARNDLLWALAGADVRVHARDQRVRRDAGTDGGGVRAVQSDGAVDGELAGLLAGRRLHELLRRQRRRSTGCPLHQRGDDAVARQPPSLRERRARRAGPLRLAELPQSRSRRPPRA